jgi:ferritin-like protein
MISAAIDPQHPRVTRHSALLYRRLQHVAEIREIQLVTSIVDIGEGCDAETLGLSRVFLSGEISIAVMSIELSGCVRTNDVCYYSI